MPVEPIPTNGATALRWLRAEEAPLAFRLLSGETEVAVLRWARHGGTLATAETSAGTWTLKRQGFLSPRLSVRAAGSPSPAAQLIPHLRHHLIELTGDGTFRFHRTSLLLPSWTLSSAAGEELLHLEPVPQGRKLEGGAVLVAPGCPAEVLPILLVFTWYFIVLAWFEDEAVEVLAPLEGPDAPRRLGDR